MLISKGVLSIFLCRQAIADYKMQQMPLSELIFGLILCLITWPFVPWGQTFWHAVSTIGFLGGFLGLSQVSRGAVGEGDGFIIATIAGMTGFMITVQVLFLALVLAAMVSLVMMLILKRDKKTTLPFVVFLFISLEVVLCASVVL